MVWPGVYEVDGFVKVHSGKPLPWGGVGIVMSPTVVQPGRMLEGRKF